MDIYKKQFKTGPVLDFERDKIQPSPRDIQALLMVREQEERMKRSLNGILDPVYMTVNLPTVCDFGGISFDVDKITFNK